MKKVNPKLIIKINKSRNRGITLIALVITIIVMLILVAITITVATNGGLFDSARKAAFLSDVSKYKEELEAYKAGYWDEYAVKNKTITETKQENIKPYIPSFDSKYDDKLKILNNELVYFGDNQKEIEWLTGIIEIKAERAEITIKIEGKGTINGSGEETKNNWIVGSTQNLSAVAGNLDINETNVEYEFAGWYKDGSLVSSETNHSITVVDTATYTARFMPKATLIYYNDSNNEEKIEINTNKTLSGYQNRTDITKVETCSNIAIATQSFKNCTSLEKITIGNNVSIVGGTDSENGNGTFGKCTNLKTVTMGENIIITGGVWSNYMFQGSDNLETVTIGSLSGISNYSLKGAKGALKGNIKINEGVTSLGASAFANCTGIISVDIPSTVTTIGQYAFHGCTGLATAILPENLTSIGQYAFYGCTNLEGVINIKSGVSLATNVFNNCEKITKVIVGDNQTIPVMSFAECKALEIVEIGNNVTIVGGTDRVNKSGTFGNCTNLKTVTMGENIKINGGSVYYNYLFYGCTALENITVKSLSEIGNRALRGAEGALKGNIAINEEVTSIGEYAFYNCTGLTDINVNMTQSQFNTNVTLGTGWNSGVTATMNYKQN